MNSRKKNAKICQEQALSLASVEVSDEELEKVVGGQGDKGHHDWHDRHGWHGWHDRHGWHDWDDYYVDHNHGYHPGGNH